ncbi:hypothetical protein CRUP_000059, partial [Coryphaenoides rupestris]
MDSFYEYLLKSYILFGEKEDYRMFQAAYDSIQSHMRRGRESCNEGEGDPPLYVNVNMFSGQIMNTWIDSLQAFFPGLQVLSGDVENAICLHAFYYAIWRRFGALPERYNWQQQAPDVLFYPLRPEMVESTYLLYQLFDEDNPLHASENKYIFTTEGHIVPIDQRFREKQWEDLFPCEDGVLAEKVLEKDPPTNTSN